ncbi:MAG: 50S ribosomal protein L14e [Caldisphaeraceae archaeon]|nr:50S ribosomal protein L14e [Caldisphaeraceae archaeon]
MPAIEIGRVCIKSTGRESGRKCIIVDIIDQNFVLITGPKEISGVKRRRVNIKHIIPTEHKLEIEKGASDEHIIKAIEDSGLLDYMRKVERTLLA